jgi:hypothetical protein
MTEQEIQTRYATQFSDLSGQIALLESVLSEHQFLSGNMQHVVVHALALRLIELARGCGLLAKAGLAAANASLGRQCLEVGFKLKAICSGKATPEDYMTQERISRAKSHRWVLKSPSALDALGPVLAAEILQEVQEAARLGNAKELKEIKPHEWAERADEVEVYRLAYSTLSDFIHCGPASLDHIVDVKSNGQVFMQTGPSDYLVGRVVEGVCHCLASSSNAIQTMFVGEEGAT